MTKNAVVSVQALRTILSLHWDNSSDRAMVYSIYIIICKTCCRLSNVLTCNTTGYNWFDSMEFYKNSITIALVECILCLASSILADKLRQRKPGKKTRLFASELKYTYVDLRSVTLCILELAFVPRNLRKYASKFSGEILLWNRLHSMQI